MKKPQSMSVKEWIIKKMAISMVIPEKTIDAVVVHQFDSANDALNIHDSVEISGFGKFYFNKKKAQAQYDKYVRIKQSYENMLADDSLTDKKRHSTEQKLISVSNDIKILKPKINEPGTNI
jgi:nucleoid DNA-binding protein